jgi:hypothetical protein
VDVAGNESNIIGSTSYILDTTAPTYTISNVGIDSDTGTSATDFITNTVTQTITGTLSSILAAGDVLYGSINNGNNWTDITSKVSGSAIEWKNVTLVGSNTICFKVSDAVGNESNIIGSTSYILDTTAPTYTISNVDISSDTGTSATDFITNTATQTITGTLSSALATGDVLYGSIDNGSNWTNITSKVIGLAITWDTATLVGSNTICFKVVDVAGNESGIIGSTSYILDTTAPIITILGINPTTVEKGTTYTEAGAIANGGEMIVVASNNVNTSIVGNYTVTYTATDSAGNVGTATRTVDVIDTTAPTITISRNGPSTLNAINNTTIVTFELSEISTNFAFGNITVVGGILGPLAQGTGPNNKIYTAVFTASPNSTTPGTITVEANKFTDAAGNLNPPSNTLIIPINTIPFTNFSLSPTSINEREIYSGTFTSNSPSITQYRILSQHIDNLYISGNTLIARYPFNYREYQNYPVKISGTSNGITIVQSFDIQIMNLPDAPISVHISNTTIPANSPIGSIVGTLNTYDHDPNDTFAYQFSLGVGGDDNSYFTIVNNKLYTSRTLDYHTKNTYTIRVKSTDTYGLSIENPINLRVILPIAGSFETSGLVGNSTAITLQGQNITGGNLQYQITQPPKYGLLKMVNMDGSFTYLPSINTQDSFQYIVKEGTMTSLPGTVVISNYNQNDIQSIPKRMGTFDFDTISFDGNQWRFGTITTNTFIQGSMYYRLGNYTLQK